MTCARLALAILLFALLTAGPALAAGLDPNFKKSYTGPQGTVTFDHQAHAERLQDCAFCHNGLKSFGGSVTEDFGHKFCLTCHQTKDNAPTDCKDCHKRS